MSNTINAGWGAQQPNHTPGPWGVERARHAHDEIHDRPLIAEVQSHTGCALVSLSEPPPEPDDGVSGTYELTRPDPNLPGPLTAARVEDAPAPKRKRAKAGKEGAA